MGRDDASSSYPWPRIEVRHRGPPRLPFPVAPTYRPRPDLVRLGGVAHGRRELDVLDADADGPAALAAKLERLRHAPRRCVALDAALGADPDAVRARVLAAAAAIVAAGPGAAGAAPGATEDDCARLGTPLARIGDAFVAGLAGWAFPAQPGVPFALRALRPDAAPVLAWIASRPAAEQPLHALALALQEDLAWMEAAPGEPARARLLHVCFPSGWDPATKIGRDFASIHAPVADAEMLRASAVALSRALTTQGPFVRFVWTVAPDGTRPRHPDDATPWDASVEPWFRCERQVSLPIPPVGTGTGAGALFLIRLHLAPLAEAACTPQRLAALRAALDSMSPATLEYKGLAARVDTLRGWIDARRGA